MCGNSGDTNVHFCLHYKRQSRINVYLLMFLIVIYAIVASFIIIAVSAFAIKYQLFIAFGKFACKRSFFLFE